MPQTTNLLLRVLVAIAAALTLLSPLAAAETLAEGEWTKKSQRIHGEWQIVSQEDGTHAIVLDEAFRTSSAPDLKIFLSRSDLKDLNNRNAVDDAVYVAKLTSNRGAQSYRFPAGIQLEDFASVIIHCERFSKLWGGAPIR